MHPSTSNLVMGIRILLALSLVLFCLPRISASFTCPSMTEAGVQEKPCSDCPDGETHDSCARSACLLICPYTIEQTAGLMRHNATHPFTPEVEQSAVFVVPSLADSPRLLSAAARVSAAGTLYILNRALLI